MGTVLKLENLHLDTCDIITSESLLYISDVIGLNDLYMEGSYGSEFSYLKEDFASSLPKLKNLLNLEMHMLPVDDHVFSLALPKLTSLQCLNLTHCEISDRTLQYIAL